MKYFIASIAILFAAICLAQSPGLITQNPSDTPVLVSAIPKGIKVELTWSHPSASHFSIRIRHQDQEETGASVGVIAHAPARLDGKDGAWHADPKPKLVGDTNWISVAVFGMTNWSNEICVIP